ncbi:MAG: hypothetical protein ACRDRH_24365 [Pseudonocardia sp.]
MADHVHADDGREPVGQRHVQRAAGVHGDPSSVASVRQAGEEYGAHRAGRLCDQHVVGDGVEQYIGTQPGTWAH